MSRITVIVTKRNGESAEVALNSLRNQTYNDYSVYVSEDTDGRGAPWARNEGFLKADKSEFTLFSDNDICWKPDALKILVNALDSNADASFAYGRYDIDGCEYSNYGESLEFDAEKLKKANYISTMSLIRTVDFCGFDETIMRFQDWDLWLTMINSGKRGVYCGKTIFTTKMRDGITFGRNAQDIRIAAEIVLKKHMNKITTKLNLGCGQYKLDGFKNLDKTTGWEFETGMDVIETESIDAITISHALMYVPIDCWTHVFNQFGRILKRKGVIRITEDSTDDSKSERYGGYNDCVTLTSRNMVRQYLEARGFYSVNVPANFSVYKDNSLMQDYHGGEPKCFFIEGIKL